MLKPQGPVLVQGAMEVEIDRLISWVQNPVREAIGPWIFVRGEMAGREVVLCRTWIGMANGAAATALAAERYHPCAVLNQGTAGSHHPDLHRGDIVLGKQVVNLGAFASVRREAGEGVCPEEWKAMPVQVFCPDNGWREASFLEGDRELLAAAKRAASSYGKGRVVEGIIGSADQWNREIDRIRWLHAHWNTWAEDMESFAAAQVAAAWGIPFLSIRVLSNSEIHGEEYERACGEDCQGFVQEVLAQMGG